MHFVTFELKGSGMARAGVLLPDHGEVIDLHAANPLFPDHLAKLIEEGPDAWARVRHFVAQASCERVPLAHVRLLAPLCPPKRPILCVGRNYPEHVQEMQGGAGHKPILPAHPVIFVKGPQCVVGPDHPIDHAVDYSHTLDYEGELAVVIGKGGRQIAQEDAWHHVFGYTIVNDLTARQIQRQHTEFFLGKNVDGCGPMGPAIVTQDEIGDPTRLRIQTRVNGEERQNESVSAMLYSIPYLISVISRTMRLEPGDVISTGTPSGVGAGFSPPRYLQAGDVVEIEIEGIGLLKNPII